MDVRFSTACTVCGLALLVSSGCQTYSPYGSQFGYPPGTHGAPPPGTYAPGRGSVTPAAPPGSNLGQPAPLGGGNGGGLKAPNPGPTTLNNRSNSTGGAGGRLPSEEPVPFPKEAAGTGISVQPTGSSTTVSPAPKTGGSPFPGGSAAPAPMGTTTPMETGTPLGAPAPKQKKDPVGNPFGEPSASSPPTNTGVKLIGDEQPARSAEPARFQPPADARPLDSLEPGTGGSPAPTPETTNKTTTSALNPYDYDNKNYTWLRGKVDYDTETKTWQIIYAPKPDLADKYGGTFLLINNPMLKGLRDHDIVLLEGKPDLANGNKPRYRIKQMFGPLVPKAQVQSSPAISPEFPGTGRNAIVTNQ